MKASAIIPNHRSERTLPATLRSLEAAARGLDVEIIVSDDEAGRGLSWARNRGLDRATGDVVFFVDADDTVRPGYFREMIALLERTDADFALSSFDMAPLKRDYNLSGSGVIRETMLPAFYGYSFDDVRRWNAGGSLMERKELGGVWRCAFRKDFLDRTGIRFDESLLMFEDGPFIAECAAHAGKVASTPQVYYNYVPGENGILATCIGTRRNWEYKFAALEARLAINRRAGGTIGRYCQASHALSALEMLALWRKAGLSFGEFRRGLGEYIAKPDVAEAIRGFPISIRHPAAAAAVLALRRFLV